MIYKGKETETKLDDLKPNSTYSFKLKVSALGDDSPFSGVASVTTGNVQLSTTALVVVTNFELQV